MSDLRPKGIEIELGGQKREFLFTINKVDEIQSEMNMPIFDAMRPIGDAADGDLSQDTMSGFKKIVSMLLTEPGTEVTEEDVGEMVDVRKYREVAWEVLNAFGISNPEPEEEDDEDDEDPKAETGQ